MYTKQIPKVSHTQVRCQPNNKNRTHINQTTQSQALVEAKNSKLESLHNHRAQKSPNQEED